MPIFKQTGSGQITIEEAERIHTSTDESPERLKKFPQLALPFGFQNAQWQSLKSQIQPGDQLWQFRTPPHTWKAMMGRAGIKLVRNGQTIATIVTLMN